MSEHKEKEQLVGDFMREMSVLMIVLYPLEAYLQGKFSWWAFVFVTIMALILLWRGIMLEGDDES